jgi:hypothetical protein
VKERVSKIKAFAPSPSSLPARERELYKKSIV